MKVRLDRAHVVGHQLRVQVVHDAAERLRRTLESRGYATTVTPDGAANRWECQATTCLVPDPKGLGMLRAEFTALAAAERGLYAGWRPLPPEEETPPASPTD